MSPDVARTAGVPKSAAAVEEAKRAVVEEAPQLVDTTAPAEDKAMADTVAKLTAAASDADRKAAAAELVAAVQADGVTAIAKLGLDAKLKAALAELKNPVAREGALAGLSALAEAFGKSAEPYLVPFLGAVLDASGDKAAPVRAAADAAGKAIIGLVGAYGISMVLPALFEAMDTRKTWQTKCSALSMLALLNTKFGDDVSRRLEDIVPVITSPMCDAKEQVKTLAFEVMSAICKNIGNRDVEAVIPAIISCLARPLEVQECVHKLGATTFVQNVESPVLSMLVPLLIRGLRERSSAIKRKSAVIIDNMAKLVDNPADALVFLPRLLPEVELVANEAADPELRNTANKAKTTLEQVRDEGAKALQLKKVEKDVVLAKLHESLKEAAGESGAALVGNAAAATVLEYMAAMASDLVGVRNFDAYIWKNELCKPFLPTFIAAADSDAVAKALLDKCYLESSSGVKAPEEEQWEGEDLCDCEFSLAYGGKILLNNARLHLKRGQRYGLCGPNGAGKSTLMRAIANGQLDGFPPKDVLRTVYVEHDIDGSKAEMVAVEFVFADDLLKGLNLTLEQVQQALTAVGFPDEYQQKPVASLSGGWKMKLALARAMLTKPDIMLLDEPTNHLDVVNVAWLQNYLVGLKDVSSIIVSHDSSFLDFTCTGIIHYENRKLKLYKGNLSKFVAVKPEAKSYYSLADTQFKFTLPEPGFLEGIKTKDRAILKVLNISYKYPGTERNIINNATVYCSLSSRVAVVGANGAGKSTLIKVLTGEVEPDSGSVWKHPNLRIAYVAQHAFHHIEQHLEKTPNEYIQWRYATGEDREGLEKESRKVTDEEAKKMAEKVVFDGQKLTVEKLLARRKAKKGYEYEVQWLGKSTDATTWLTRDVLESMGFTKMVNEIDIKEAAAMGLYSKPLTAANIQKHLENIGLEAEFGTHSQMRGLSGGQKVKVVLAAATWMNPHLIVLDEPTNYLDRDSLGALAGAIKEYGGGVVMITHNSEFSSALCPETWVVADGRVDTKGDPAWQLAASKEKVETKQQEETTDAYGNTIKIKGPKKKLSNKEKKAYEKLKKARRERGEEVSEDEEDS